MVSTAWRVVVSILRCVRKWAACGCGGLWRRRDWEVRNYDQVNADIVGTGTGQRTFGQVADGSDISVDDVPRMHRTQIICCIIIRKAKRTDITCPASRRHDLSVYTREENRLRSWSKQHTLRTFIVMPQTVGQCSTAVMSSCRLK